MSLLLGFDLGGTRIKHALVTEGGDVLDRGAAATEDSDGSRDLWRSHILALRARMGEQHASSIRLAIAAPGLVGRHHRQVDWMCGRMEALAGLDWTEFLGLGVDVPVINDAQAALLGEVWCGAAVGAANVAMLTLGTGVGGACMVDGNILSGAIGRAGHLGHISLNPGGPLDIVNTPGSLEHAIGECTLLRRTSGRFTSTRDMLDAALAGDSAARAVWERSLLALAAAMTSIINVTDPELFLLGGGIAAAGEDLFTPLAALMHKFEWRPLGGGVSIRPAALGEFAGAIGAARLAGGYGGAG